jgi:hypothetical protein
MESMTKSVSMIGIDPGELRWVRLLVSLLRHPDPTMPELAREALLYLSGQAQQGSEDRTQPLDIAG